MTDHAVPARSRLAYAALYASIGASFPYLALFYRDVGLDVATIGLVVSLGSIVALAAGPAWGLLSDRRRGSPWILLAAAGCAVVGALGLSQARAVAAILAGVVVYFAGSGGLSPIVDARALERSGPDRAGFGPLRAWGSIAYVVAATGTGVAVDRFGVEAIFAVIVVALLATGIVGFGLRPVPGAAAVSVSAAVRPAGPSAILRALWTRDLGPFLVGAWLVFTAVYGVQSFLTLRYAALAAPASVIGLSAGVGAAAEVPVMLAFPWLGARVGWDRLLVVGALIFTLRAFVAALTAAPWILVVMSGIGGLGYACFIVGGVTYVSRHAPRELAATAQGLFSGLAMGLGQVVAGVVGGGVGQVVGLPGLFLASGIVGLGAAAIVAVAVGSAGRPLSPRRRGERP